MEEKTCFQCNGALYSIVGGGAIKCPSCAVLNEEIEQYKHAIFHKKGESGRKLAIAQLSRI